MIKGSSTALKSRNKQLQLSLQIQKELYLRNSGIVWTEIPSMTPMEVPRLLSLVVTCCGSSKVWVVSFNFSL